MKKSLPKTKPPTPSGDLAPGAASPAGVPLNLRRLEWNELVRPGDFEEDGAQGFRPWDGPPGFRADAFVETVYRRPARPPAGTGKSS